MVQREAGEHDSVPVILPKAYLGEEKEANGFEREGDNSLLFGIAKCRVVRGVKYLCVSLLTRA